MEYDSFPQDFPDVGGKTFKQVADDPKYCVFCKFVIERMENCTGLFLQFQMYLNKRNGSDCELHKPDCASSN